MRNRYPKLACQAGSIFSGSKPLQQIIHLGIGQLGLRMLLPQQA